VARLIAALVPPVVYPAVVTVRRFDAAELGQAKRTPQGFLRATARLTRTGVLTYRRADGSVSRELRRPGQVFSAESLATLGDAPLTDLHPKEMVSPDNAKALSVGHVSHASARADGKFVEASCVITDAKMIAAVEAGTRREISCGYKCKLVVGSGTYDGERYDAEQVDIVYNHAGLGPPKWGRAGSEVALRFDADGLEGGRVHGLVLEPLDAVVVMDARGDDADVPADVPETEGSAMDLVTLRVDSIDCQLPKECVQVVSKGLEQRDALILKATQDAAASKARFDALQGELDGTKLKLAEASDVNRFDAAVTERIALLDRARQLLGAETKLDGLSARAIKELVIKQADPKAEFTGKSDEYVQGRFDSAEPSPSTELGGVRRIMTTIPRRTDARTDTRVDSADPNKYPVPAWRKPLAATRD
jgi:hypothetical protein